MNTTTRSHADVLGLPVLSWTYQDKTRYEGEPDTPGMTTLTVSLLHPGMAGLKAELHTVAPANTPIPAADPRVVVTQSTKDEARAYGHPYPTGIWRLDLPGTNPTWHRTKGDATATGLRRIAITDWHTTPAPDAAGSPADDAPVTVCETCEDYVEDPRLRPTRNGDDDEYGHGWVHIENDSSYCPGQGDDDTGDYASPRHTTIGDAFPDGLPD